MNRNTKRKIKQFWNSNSLNEGVGRWWRNAQNTKDFLFVCAGVLICVLLGWCIDQNSTPKHPEPFVVNLPSDYALGDDWVIVEKAEYVHFERDLMTDEVTVNTTPKSMSARVGNSTNSIFGSNTHLEWSSEYGTILSVGGVSTHELQITLRFDGGELVETTWIKVGKYSFTPKHPEDFQQLLLRHRDLIIRFNTGTYVRTVSFNIAGYYKVVQTAQYYD